MEPRKEELMRQLKHEIEECRKCNLYKSRKEPVIGSGNLDAKIMFCGEAPGYWEDIKGEPFVGAAGKIFDDLLISVGLKRQDVYIANLLKCRPPDNRDPQKEEMQACAPYLERQIQIVKPEVICPLGRYSMRFLMEKYGLGNRVDSISKIHGKLFEAESLFYKVVIIPFYHPAVATYNPNMREVLQKDFKILEQFK